MRLVSVEIRGFKSFRDVVVFKFSDAVGVVRLSGKNIDEPALGANGAGKTSLWNAVYWCLYGKAPSGLRSPELASWGLGKGTIRVAVMTADATLIRTWGGKINTLTLNGEDMTQVQVDAWVGLNAEQFLYCAYLAQHGTTFLDLGAQEKTDLLSTVLGLDTWLEMSKEADDKLERCENDLNAINLSMNKRQGALDMLASTNYEAKLDEWDEANADSIRELHEGLKDLNESGKELLAKHTRRKKTLEDAVAIVEDLLDVVAAANKVEASLDREASTEEATIEALKRTLDAHDKDTCPTCKQPWPKSMREHTNAVQDDIDAARARLRPLVIAHTKAQRSIQTAQIKYEQARTNLDEIKDEMREITLAGQDIDRRIKAQGRSIADARNAVNPYAKMVEDKARDLADLRHRISSLENERALLEAYAQRLGYWVKGFKDVRLFLITEALAHLEVEVNSAVMQLGLVDWAIRFAPDSETKSGTIKRGFSVTIESPNNPRPVPWAAWSGGEAQRLRLAATWGLANLIASYTGYQAFIEVFDEASAGLSPEGIADMLQALFDRAQLERKQIWVVDHQPLESSVFIETVQAVKENGTTRLELLSTTQGE